MASQYKPHYFSESKCAVQRNESRRDFFSEFSCHMLCWGLGKAQSLNSVFTNPCGMLFRVKPAVRDPSEHSLRAL